MSSAPDLSILVVEDDEISLDVTRNVLRGHGFEVLTARNFYEAIEYIEKGAKIDIAIVDVIMPPGTPHGLSFAQMARERRPSLKVIFMSGNINPKGYALYGKNEAFLCKPFAPDLLLEVVQRTAA